MNVENIVVNIMLVTSSIALLILAVIYNVKLPPLLKDYKDKTEKIFFVAAFTFGEILLLCTLILVVNGIIGML